MITFVNASTKSSDDSPARHSLVRLSLNFAAIFSKQVRNCIDFPSCLDPIFSRSVAQNFFVSGKNSVVQDFKFLIKFIFVLKRIPNFPKHSMHFFIAVSPFLKFSTIQFLSRYSFQTTSLLCSLTDPSPDCGASLFLPPPFSTLMWM